jgi:kumamolisin
VLACGGTKLDANGSTITSEVVWNEQAINDGATGGGVSNVFPLPSWQANSNVPAPSSSGGGRGVPDVAGDADPESGYTIRVDGQSLVIGGTSAVAPLWAGLVAVANQQLGVQVGFIQPAIYAASATAGFNDITQGNNGAFSAGPGWDACTGQGSPIASALIPLLAPAGTNPTPTPAPVPPVKKKKKKKTAKAVVVKSSSVRTGAKTKAASKKATKKSGAKKLASKKAAKKRAGGKTKR